MSARASHHAAQRGRAASPRQHLQQSDQEELQRENEQLRRDNEELRKQIAEQQQQIADLERQLAAHKRNSTNSSKPPSSDGLAGEPRQRGRRHKSRRKPGGQRGHCGRHRELVPAERVDEVQVVLPPQCGHCGRKLPTSAERVQTEGEPRRHQVTDVPVVRAQITEYQCPNVVCAGCGKTTRAPLPEEVRRQFGPQLTALVAYLTVGCRLPRRLVEGMLADVLGIEISLGSTQTAWEEASEAVQQPYQQLQEQLPQQAVLNVDETGWRNNGDKRWIWALVASQFVFYTVAAHRSAEVLVSLLGVVFRGILCSDRLPVYLKYHAGKMQLCWAHLKRNLQGILDHPQSLEGKHFARDALAQYARLFRLWWKFRAGRIDRQQLIDRSKRIRSKFRSLAVSYWDSYDREVANLANAFGQHLDRLFCFLEESGVEPTNNAAERALRTAVQWRKISFGNRSRTGEIATGRLLTVAQTCRMQQRHVLGYLTEAVRCHRHRTAAPPLLSPGQRPLPP